MILFAWERAKGAAARSGKTNSLFLRFDYVRVPPGASRRATSVAMSLAASGGSRFSAAGDRHYAVRRSSSSCLSGATLGFGTSAISDRSDPWFGTPLFTQHAQRLSETVDSHSRGYRLTLQAVRAPLGCPPALPVPNTIFFIGWGVVAWGVVVWGVVA